MMARIIFALFILLPVTAYADSQEVLSKFYPYIFVLEQYTDNLNLTSTNRQEDWITMISPGLRFSTLPVGSTPATTSAPSGIDLNYRLGLVYFAKNDQYNYVSHSGSLNTWYTFSPRLSFRLREYIIRSDEPREREYTAGALPDQFILGYQRGRSTYIRNVLEPSVVYRFGREDRFELYYRNMIYENENPNIENSQENYISPRLIYWFNIRNGVSLEYGLSSGHFETSPDFLRNSASGRYTYRFNPRTSVFGQYTFVRYDFESPGIDYDVHTVSFGIAHAFTPTLSGTAQVGPYWQNPENGTSANGFFYNAVLTQHAEKTTYSVLFQGGYYESYFAAENFGFTQYNRAIGTITHRLRERIILGCSGALERPEYVDRKDWTYRVRGNASYRILPWLFFSVEAYHQENDSNVDSASYIENRILFRLTAGMPGEWVRGMGTLGVY